MPESGGKKILLIIFVLFLSAGIYFGIAYGLPVYGKKGIVKSKESSSTVTSPVVPVVYPNVVSTYPLDGQKDISLDIENPIVVNFDKSTKGFFIRFVLDPSVEVVYENNPDKTQFKLMPKEVLLEGQKYKLEIDVKQITEPDENYKKIATSFFETLPKAPANWEKDFTLRLEQAKKYTKAKIATGKYIDINVKQQILSIFENGNLVNSFLVSSGKKGMDTPPGEYQIRNKSPRVWSKTYGLFMPFWMAVANDGKFGIHELPEWPGGYKEGANHLGTPVSHGCIRLGVGSAKTVYDWTEVGTPVVIY